MGKFVNTGHLEMTNSIIDGFEKSLIKNPYAIFREENPIPVIWYQIDLKNSSLDDSTRVQQSPIGRDSPIRFNKINNLYLFGLNTIEPNLVSGENGLEMDSISGDCFDIPNTINPVPGCYFELPYLSKKDGGGKHYLFMVTDVSIDTLSDDNNYHKISYELSRTSNDTWKLIQDQVIDEFEFSASLVGTEFNSVILSSSYKMVEKLEGINDILKKYYYELFFNPRVGTFTYVKDNTLDNVYDPYMIEFLIRNTIMKNSTTDYLYIDHALAIPKTFSIDYARTLFRSIETLDKESVNRSKYFGCYNIITSPLSAFYKRQEYYNCMTYSEGDPTYRTYTEILDTDLLSRLVSGALYDINDTRAIYNILISAINGKDITGDCINSLENIEYVNSKTMFYSIPLIIFSIDYYVKEILLKHNDK